MRSGSFYDPAPITRAEAEAALRIGDADAICDALVRIAYHEADAEWLNKSAWPSSVIVTRASGRRQ